MSQPDGASHPKDFFHDLDAYLTLRRLTSLRLSPDGTRLAVAVQQLDPKKTGFVSAIWEIDPAGERPARRLTRSAPGESAPGFTRDGDLLFGSKRPNPDDAESKDEKPALWLLPKDGGEARLIAERPGGIGAFTVAKDSGEIALTSGTMPGTTTLEDDTEAQKYRKDKKVAAILHSSGPIRWWDHDLGPEQERLFIGGPLGGPAGGSGAADGAAAVGDSDAKLELRDLTPAPGRGLDEASFDLSNDGRVLVTGWQVRETGGEVRETVVLIDVATGERRTIADDAEYGFTEPRLSPDASKVVAVRSVRGNPETGAFPASTLWLIDVETGQGSELVPDLDLYPASPFWSPDGSKVYFVADENGRAPIFAVDAASGAITRLVNEGAYTDVQVSSDGEYLYALRNGLDSPPFPVRIKTALEDQQPKYLLGPDERPALPGTLTEVETIAADGATVRAWLVLPEGGQVGVKHPLLLWAHGGPYMSWNGWQWRWNAWLMAAKGYAVLLPDPALSTGYGRSFVQRGYGEWGGAPYTDLMAITEAVAERADIDETRVGMMGGSYGGYMANWMAGHTDRFKAIVTHASLWALDQMSTTTDFSADWWRSMTDEQTLEFSPHRYADNIVTPMLVIHGDKDYRVPIGEGLRLWHDLVTRHKGAPDDLPHRFLYFPNENHWVTSPEHIKIWYGTVFAFLAWHVLGGEWEPPAHV